LIPPLSYFGSGGHSAICGVQHGEYSLMAAV
jgi:hypothetical protein